MAQAHPQLKLISIIALVLSLAACVSAPSVKYQQRSQAYGFLEKTISTEVFDHSIFSNQKVNPSSALHVYIEGDGQPFIHQRYINNDPTSVTALGLTLMHADPNPSVLIGRPCYHGHKSDNCVNNKWWTSHRYSEQVVSSMAKTINALNSGQRDIILIGFSGGGSIAMLLAGRVDRLKKIVTVNANLDIDAWTQYHAYTPLKGSLNPIDYLDKTAPWEQIHLVGGRDKNVTHTVWQDKIQSAANARIITYPNFNHTCCWASIWLQILDQYVAEH